MILQMSSGMLLALEKLHLQGYVHRDIKPPNFCLGHGKESNTIFLIDFGFVQPLPKKVSLYVPQTEEIARYYSCIKLYP